MNKCIYEIVKCERFQEFTQIREVLHMFVPMASKADDGSREALQRNQRLEPCVQYMCVPLNELSRIILNTTVTYLKFYGYKIPWS